MEYVQEPPQIIIQIGLVQFFSSHGSQSDGHHFTPDQDGHQKDIEGKPFHPEGGNGKGYSDPCVNRQIFPALVLQKHKAEQDHGRHECQSDDHK